MKWETVKLSLPGRETVEASAPVIISASRRCDIPAFQSRKFTDDLNRGYAIVPNPYTGKPGYISFEKARLFVFWTKYPKPFFPVLEHLRERSINFYFQFTLNDYEKEGYEKGLPSLEERIESFISLSGRYGAWRVIWRFDPLLLTDRLSLPELLSRIETIARKLSPHTHRLVFSFADIVGYHKVDQNMNRMGINYLDFSREQMVQTAQFLAQVGKEYEMEVSTCCEAIDLTPLGITPNRCIDNRLIARLFPDDRELMDLILGKYPVEEVDLNYSIIRDRGQRRNCGCILSKDIGAYRQCKFGCVYCYAR